MEKNSLWHRPDAHRQPVLLVFATTVGGDAVTPLSPTLHFVNRLHLPGAHNMTNLPTNMSLECGMKPKQAQGELQAGSAVVEV